MHALSMAWKNELQDLGLGRTLAAGARRHAQAAETSDSQPLRPTLPANDIPWLDQGLRLVLMINFVTKNLLTLL